MVLVIGKFTGVLLFTWLHVKFKFAELPKHPTWRHIVGISALVGIGFTILICFLIGFQ